MRDSPRNKRIEKADFFPTGSGKKGILVPSALLYGAENGAFAKF
jgi:hypothetical protein